MAAAPRWLTREEMRSALRDDATPVILGILILAVAAIAAVYLLRARDKDRAVIWFSLFAALYGTRLLASSQIVPFAMGVPRQAAAFVVSVITYLIAIPANLLLGELFPPWRGVLRWVLVFQLCFAAAGIALDIAEQTPGALHAANNVIVLIGTVALGALLVIKRSSLPEARILQIGIGAQLFATVLGNIKDWIHMDYDPEPVGFGAFLATLVWVLVDRARTKDDRLRNIEAELQTARKIQLSILPREMPNSPNLRIAARYLPMTEVAGDFYDFLMLDENRVGVLIADVSGHGVPAALIASMVKVAIAAQAGHADDPAKVLRGMNQTLCGKMQGQFVTAAYLFLDLKRQTMRYGAAGHPPLLWVKNGGTVEPVEENGLMLGFLPAAGYTSVEHSFEKGDRFLLYTDGLPEAANAAGEFFGDDRLRASAARAGAGTVESGASGIVDELARWRKQQDDDLTVVLVEACPGSL